MKKYSHLVFDIDGTLLDSRQADLQALQDTLMELQGRRVPIEQLEFAFGIPGEVSLRQLGITDIQQANRLWNLNVEKYMDKMTLFSGISHLLQQLKAQGFRLGIVTSRERQEYASAFSNQFEEAAWFDTVICVEDAPHPKPHPAPLMAYLSQTGIRAQEALYIGDTLYDSRCAQGAGVDFGLAQWGCIASHSIPAAYTFGSPQEVLNVV